MTVVRWTDLGRMAYDEALALQKALVAERKAGRGSDRLLLVEHPPVVTLGRRAEEGHVLVDEPTLAARGIARRRVERGGDVTYHGPGQLVAYPVLDLRDHRKDVRWYSCSLLETVVATLAAFGVAAEAREGRETGVWVPDPDGTGPAAKIAALGVRIERWVTYHGVALNVDPDLSHFDLIVPCGLTETAVTSMRAVLGRPVGAPWLRSPAADGRDGPSSESVATAAAHDPTPARRVPDAVRAAFRQAFAETFDVELVHAPTLPQLTETEATR